MTQEEKSLLLQDICGRLPYEVKVRINTKHNYYNAIVCEVTRNYICVEGGGEICFSHGTYKPYLRPMQSMTEEECEYYDGIRRYLVRDDWEVVDWLNEHHFDYRGLIEKGLALEAPEGIYSTKTEL